MMADQIFNLVGRLSTGLVLLGLLAVAVYSAARLAFSFVTRPKSVAPTFVQKPEGPFHAFGKIFYRFLGSRQVFELKPVEATLNPGSDLPVVKLAFMPLEEEMNETLLNHAPPPTLATGDQIPNFLVNLGVRTQTGIISVGVGWREGDYLFTARHTFEHPSAMLYGLKSFVLYNGDKSVDVKAEEFISTKPLLKATEFQFTGHDVLAVKILASAWSVLGTRSAKCATYSSVAEGRGVVFGNPDGPTLIASGAITSSPDLEKKGLIGYKISTTTCFSGSPVVLVHMGVPRIIAMHICGNLATLPGTCNYGASLPAINRLRTLLKLKPAVDKVSLLASLKPIFGYNESREKDRDQGEFESEFSEESVAGYQTGIAGEATVEEKILASGSKSATRELAHQGEYAEMHSQNDERRAEAYAAQNYADYHSNLIGGGGGRTKELTQLESHGFSVRLKGKSWNDMMEEDAGWNETRTIVRFDREATPDPQDRLTQFLSVNRAVKLFWTAEEVVQYAQFAVKGPNRLQDVAHKMSDLDQICCYQVSPKMSKYRFVLCDIQDADAVGCELNAPSAPPLSQALYNKPSSVIATTIRGDSDRVSSAPSILENQTRFISTDLLPVTHLDQRAFSYTCLPPVWQNVPQDPPIVPLLRSSSVDASLDYNLLASRAFTALLDDGDWAPAAELYNVGASTLLETAFFASFKNDYLAAGKFTEKTITKLGTTVSIPDKNGSPFALKRGSCATTSVGKSKASTPMSEEALAALEQQGIHLRDDEFVSTYALPPTGDAAILESLRAQAAKQVPGTWDKLRERAYSQENWCEKIDEFVNNFTPAVSSHTFLQQFEYCLDTMDGTKSSGWSSVYKAGPKSVWKDAGSRSRLCYFVVCRIFLRFAEADNLANLAPFQMVLRGLSDPRISFVKGEAHNKKKQTSKSWRLIWIPSIVDSLIQAIFHTQQNKQDIADYGSGLLTNQAVGIGHHDDGIRHFGRILEEMTHQGRTNVVDEDASGWDLSVRRTAILFDAEVRIRLLAKTTRYDTLIACAILHEGFVNSAHCLAIGRDVWEFQQFGITASGVQSTSAQNSRARTFQALAAGASRAVSVGDDLVYSGNVDVDLVRSCGTIVKEQHTCPAAGPVSMTSHDFMRGRDGIWSGRFMNLEKLFAHIDLRRVPNLPPSDDVVKGALFAVRNSKADTQALKTYVTALGGRVDLEPELNSAFRDLT